MAKKSLKESIYTPVRIDELQLCVLSPQVDVTYIAHVCCVAAPSSFSLGNTSKFMVEPRFFYMCVCAYMQFLYISQISIFRRNKETENKKVFHNLQPIYK